VRRSEVRIGRRAEERRGEYLDYIQYIYDYSLFTIHLGYHHCFITIVFLTCVSGEAWIEGDIGGGGEVEEVE
jgi:hypothetical protein